MKKHCVDCDKKITGKKHCQKCYLKFHNPMKKIINKRKLGERGKNKVRELNANYKHGLTCWKSKKYYCQDCGIEVNSGLAKRCPKCANRTPRKRCSHRGKLNPMYGKTIKARWGKYKNINMRSSWEIAFAKWLDKNNIIWFYESKRFNLGNTTYLPDFYLPEKEVYVEIKGYMTFEAYGKLKKFIQKFPEKKLVILRKKDLIKAGVLGV